MQYLNRFYAANCDNNSINVFEHPADQWKHVYSFPIEMNSASDITLGISNGLLYVCSSHDHRISAYTLKGAVQFTTGKPGKRAAGRLRWPRICDTDASGAVHVADHCNDRLQVLSTNGKWNVLQLVPPTKSPWSACVVNNTLYVSHQSNHKLIISTYKCD